MPLKGYMMLCSTIALYVDNELLFYLDDLMLMTIVIIWSMYVNKNTQTHSQNKYREYWLFSWTKTIDLLQCVCELKHETLGSLGSIPSLHLVIEGRKSGSGEQHHISCSKPRNLEINVLYLRYDAVIMTMYVPFYSKLFKYVKTEVVCV